MKSAIRRDGGFTTPYLIAAVCCFMLAGAMLWFWLFGLPLLDSGGTATDDEIDWNTAIDAGYDAIYAAYLTDADTYRFGANAKGEDYLVTGETDDAITFLQFDRESDNGSCAVYAYERCPKNADGSWSQQDAELLNTYAYDCLTGETAASGKTGWGDAPSAEYAALTGE